MKNLKKVLSVILILSLALTMAFALISCGDDNGKNTDENDPGTDDGKTAYTVTVKDKDGNAVSGAKVQIVIDGIAPVGKEVATGTDGKAEIRLKSEDNYHAKVTAVPQGYVLPTSTVKLVDNAATVEIEKLPVYTVYVKDASGNPIAGAAVQICDASGACQLPKLTDASGKIESALKSDTYKAKVVSAPEAYAFTEDYFYLENNTVTIVLQAK